MRFVQSRTVTVAGFAPDANPNITAPSAGNIFALSDRNGSNGDISVGIGLVAIFVKAGGGTFEDDTAAATVSFVLWIQDSAGAGWIRLTSDTATHRVYKVSADVLGASSLFAQVTAINNNTATATSVKLLLREV